MNSANSARKILMLLQEHIISSTPVKPILQMIPSDTSSLNSMESIEKSTQEPMASSSSPDEPIGNQEIVHISESESLLPDDILSPTLASSSALSLPVSTQQPLPLESESYPSSIWFEFFVYISGSSSSIICLLSLPLYFLFERGYFLNLLVHFSWHASQSLKGRFKTYILNWIF